MPVFPLSVKTVLLVPVQTVAAPAIDPATDAGFMVTVVADEFAVEHDPLWTTALN